MRQHLWAAVLAALWGTPVSAQQPADSAAPLFKLEEVMLPVRDGVHLQTVILTPLQQSGPLPIRSLSKAP